MPTTTADWKAAAVARVSLAARIDADRRRDQKLHALELRLKSLATRTLLAARVQTDDLLRDANLSDDLEVMLAIKVPLGILRELLASCDV